ncbi:MAG: carbon storage regulator CsrA [Phycisphaeraceae bacterium]|nr:carbon storage regulator CsrA [Phycisphaeraceae bacterium]
MLVLSRQRDETIMIGDEIEITVVDIRGDKVRLGITAPTRIAVHRKEVYEAIRRENEQAARVTDALAESDLTAISRTISPGPARRKGGASRISGAPPGASPPAAAPRTRIPSADERRTA